MTGQRLTDAILREAVRARVDETSYRAVADQVGMSWSGLKSFADGGSPRRSTRQLLTRWYYRQVRGLPGVPKEDFEAAMAQVLVYLRDNSKPATVRERERREIIDRLRNEAE
jgi:hypothetical protein